jgi:hypothetical protein
MLAIASFVVSPLICFGMIPAIVLGIVSLNQIKKSGDKGRGIAIAGIVVGALWVVFCTLVWTGVLKS